MLDFDVENSEIGAYGAVGSYFEDGFDELSFRDALKAMGGKDVKINLRSDGGDVFAGLSIVNQIRAYKGLVTITIDALAASIASVIAAAADEVFIHDGSMMMIHNPWTVAMGDSTEFRGVADLLDKIAGEIAGVYEAKSGRESAEFLRLMETDTYLTAKEAEELGLVDGIIYPKDKRKTVAAAAAKPIASAAAFPRTIAAKHRLRETRLK